MVEQMAKPEYKVKIEGVVRVEKIQEEGYQIPVLQTREEVIEFLIMLLDGRNKKTHPSGEPNPSEADIKIKNWLVQACDLVGIRALDHVIIGGDGYMGLVDEELMKEG
jgi:hypothetical protein